MLLLIILYRRCSFFYYLQKENRIIGSLLLTSFSMKLRIVDRFVNVSFSIFAVNALFVHNMPRTFTILVSESKILQCLLILLMHSVIELAKWKISLKKLNGKSLPEFPVSLLQFFIITGVSSQDTALVFKNLIS